MSKPFVYIMDFTTSLLSRVYTSDITISKKTKDKFSMMFMKTKQKEYFFNLLLTCHSLCS